ncbi:hypothetical protein HYDPIDRAFT_116977 [Hydnomerulius pinastri MD-312]|uniref:Uncharacterized protein n=1 Tax=Hydnomerulius pinastri MD-312 TaxID=994086 RepID=A0A0C9W315_9AGAM|nr:hypothetical protein HYDPIDRAFT_116977 [Hydnomerulius pinastri MD-312]
MLRCALPHMPDRPLCIYLQPLAGPSNQWVRTRVGELIPLPRDGELFENTAIFVKETSFFDPRRRKRAVSIDTIATHRESTIRSTSVVRPLQTMSPETIDETPPEAEITIVPPTPTPVLETLPLLPDTPPLPIPPLPPTGIPSHSPIIRQRDLQPTPPPRKDTRKQRPTAIPTEFSVSEPRRLPSQKRHEFSPESPTSPLLSPLQEFRDLTPPPPLLSPLQEFRGLTPPPFEGPVSKTWRSKSYARMHPERPGFWGQGNPMARSVSPPSTSSNGGNRSVSPAFERAYSSDRELDRSPREEVLGPVPGRPRGSSLTVPGAPPLVMSRSSARVERSAPVGSARAQSGRSKPSSRTANQPPPTPELVQPVPLPFERDTSVSSRGSGRGRNPSQKPLRCESSRSRSPPARPSPITINIILPDEEPESSLGASSSFGNSEYSASSFSAPPTPPVIDLPLRSTSVPLPSYHREDDSDPFESTPNPAQRATVKSRPSTPWRLAPDEPPWIPPPPSRPIIHAPIPILTNGGGFVAIDKGPVGSSIPSPAPSSRHSKSSSDGSIFSKVKGLLHIR